MDIFPEEIWLEIFSYLDNSFLLFRVPTVCKTWLKYIRNDINTSPHSLTLKSGITGEEIRQILASWPKLKTVTIKWSSDSKYEPRKEDFPGWIEKLIFHPETPQSGLQCYLPGDIGFEAAISSIKMEEWKNGESFKNLLKPVVLKWTQPDILHETIDIFNFFVKAHEMLLNVEEFMITEGVSSSYNVSGATISAFLMIYRMVLQCTPKLRKLSLSMEMRGDYSRGQPSRFEARCLELASRDCPQIKEISIANHVWYGNEYQVIKKCCTDFPNVDTLTLKEVSIDVFAMARNNETYPSIKKLTLDDIVIGREIPLIGPLIKWTEFIKRLPEVSILYVRIKDAYELNTIDNVKSLLEPVFASLKKLSYLKVTIDTWGYWHHRPAMKESFESPETLECFKQNLSKNCYVSIELMEQGKMISYFCRDELSEEVKYMKVD